MRLSLLAAALLLLSACTGVAVKEPTADNTSVYQSRAATLAAIQAWGLTGRISLDDGEQGGSGRLQWDVHSQGSELDFYGAMGRGAWHLSIGPDISVLKEANGVESSAAEADSLIQQRIGWPLPLAALQWWVRGLAAPGGGVAEQKFGNGGGLARLQQHGWKIKFSRYTTTAGIVLPTRLEARRENYRVKLAISNWRIGKSDVAQ